VLLDGVPAQWGYPAGQRDRLWHYRWGPSSRALSDPSWRHGEIAFRGNGLRPYAVCHLRARASGGDLLLNWMRRTRIDGDSWTGAEVPLGEEKETYLLRVLRGGTVRREVEVTSPAWIYTAVQRAGDGPGPLRIEVAQVSQRFGPGPFRSLDLPS